MATLEINGGYNDARTVEAGHFTEVGSSVIFYSERADKAKGITSWRLWRSEHSLPAPEREGGAQVLDDGASGLGAFRHLPVSRSKPAELPAVVRCRLLWCAR